MTKTVKHNWKLPEHPKEPCSICGKVISIPYVYDTGDGWLLGWDCEDECGWDENFMEGEDAWPFVDDTAGIEDFRKLGFKYV